MILNNEDTIKKLVAHLLKKGWRTATQVKFINGFKFLINWNKEEQNVAVMVDEDTIMFAYCFRSNTIKFNQEYFSHQGGVNVETKILQGFLPYFNKVKEGDEDGEFILFNETNDE